MHKPWLSTGSYSLRKQLLLWVIIPMFILIPLDTTILYNIGIHFVNQSFDDSMEDVANDITALINVSGKQPEAFKMSEETQNVLFSNQFDKTYFAIYDDRYQRLTGNRELLFKSCLTTQQRCFHVARIHQEAARILLTKSTYMDAQQRPHPYYIQIAETMHKRKNLRSRILFAIVFPQLLLMMVTGVMLLWGISKGLAPLDELNHEISKRSGTELDPVILNHVPEEATVLVNSINQLMGRLRNAIQSQNRFIADAAHQLRTPLAGIQAQVDLAISQHHHLRQLPMIGDSVFKLTHLVNQLLRLSRNQPEAANFVNLKPVDLLKLAQAVCTELIHFALRKEIDLGFESRSELPIPDFLLLGDGHRLSIMLFNLLDNAIRYTPEHGRVTLAIHEYPDYIAIRVEDNGVGIPEEERDMVFERFHRVLDNSQEGSGLGLAIAREIALLHGASLEVSTPQRAPGTLMTVRLPKSAVT